MANHSKQKVLQHLGDECHAYPAVSTSYLSCDVSLQQASTIARVPFSFGCCHLPAFASAQKGLVSYITDKQRGLAQPRTNLRPPNPVK